MVRLKATQKDSENKTRQIKPIQKKKKKVKRIMKCGRIRISTWNVRTMLQPGKMQEIAAEMSRYKIDVAAVQETRWSGEGIINKNNYDVYYSGDKKQGQYGTAIFIFNEFKNKVMDFRPINDRMIYCRISTKPFKLSILNIYAPTERATVEEKDVFYESLEEEIERIPKEDTIIVLGDFNAQVGKEHYVRQVAGKYTIHEKTNDNGQRLCRLATRSNLIISSTKHKHPKVHKATWASPDQKHHSQIDHVLITKRKQSSIIDVRTYRGACVDSDHFMVTATLRHKIKKIHKTKKTGPKWSIDKLNNESTREKYAEELDKKLIEQGFGENDVDVSWNNIKKCVHETTERCIGREKQSNNKEWYSEECHEAVKEKKKSRLKWIRTNTKKDKEEYEEMRNKCNKIIRKHKKEWIENKVKDIEEVGLNRNTKRFYQKVNEQNRTHKAKACGIKNKNGKLAENEEEYKQVWKEHFTELLTEAQQSNEIDGQETTEDREVAEPTVDEIKEIIGKSRNGKTPGKDGINIELIKYGGDEIQKHIYELIKKIWRDENMPREWETGQIVTIHKKGNQQTCENYRGITLLSTTYKILSTILQRRLTTVAGNVIGQYQCGFTKGRSTVDAIHTVKQIVEKTLEYNINTEMLFIDFKQAFDSIKRERLMLALKELGIPAKLRRLIRMTMRKTLISVKTQKGETEEFEINKGVRQGDALSATLFNLALEYVMKKTKKEGTLRTRGGQIVAYADDIAIITKSRKIMEEMLQGIVEEGSKIGLKINEAKTKIMILGKKAENKEIKIGGYSFEQVDRFKYLGITITSGGEREVEIKEKIMATNRAFCVNKKLLKSKILTHAIKMRIYRTIIRPITLYAAEVMTMTKKDEENLRVTERKIIRTILGPIKIAENEYRPRMNYEIEQELEGEDIVKMIKRQRVRWLGHVWRSEEKDTIKAIVEWKPGGRRSRGRPRSTWLREVEEDLRTAGIEKWKNKTSDRKIWRNVIKTI